jgi:mevalonate kinase
MNRMKRKDARTFYAKLMLFGEYTILLGSKALSIPYRRFEAQLGFIGEHNNASVDPRVSNQRITELLHYFKTKTEYFGEILDLRELEADAARGLFLESTIPQGYGLGSSGALCAALYDAYALDPLIPGESPGNEKISGLTTILAAMESLFHGKSSGFDPTSCYIRKALYLDEKKQLTMPDIDESSLISKGNLFLIDTGSVEKTSPLVALFLNQFLLDGEPTEPASEFCILSNECIDNLLVGTSDSFWKSMKSFSAFQLQHLSYMIPEKFHAIWESGIRNDLFYLKLCGSGGGGYLLGFAPGYENYRDFITSRGFDLVSV